MNEDSFDHEEMLPTFDLDVSVEIAPKKVDGEIYLPYAVETPEMTMFTYVSRALLQELIGSDDDMGTDDFRVN